MQRILLCALFCAASLSVATPAFAWMSEPARNPDNGHYYAFFSGAIGFESALTGAASLSYLGVPGHLATITSQAEQDFVLEYYKNPGPGRPRVNPYEEKFWIAASDAAVEGEWRWVAGPEAGQPFWQGDYKNGHALGYQNWLTGSGISGTIEPNNHPEGGLRLNPEGEDYVALKIYRQPSWSFWNDVIGLDDGGRWSPRYGIVEFSVPEPSSGALTAIAGSMLVAACRRRSKSAARR